MNRCGLTPNSAPSGSGLVRPGARAGAALVFLAPPAVPLPAFGFLNRGPRASREGEEGGGRRLRKVRIRGDGRCLYRAIARALAHGKDYSLSESYERQDADALRLLAHKVICQEKRDEFRKSMIIEGSIDSYCDLMTKPTFFGGEAEMFALSGVLKTPIAVYIEDNKRRLRNVITYGEKWANVRNVKPINVLYNGHNHYDVLL